MVNGKKVANPARKDVLVSLLLSAVPCLACMCRLSKRNFNFTFYALPIATSTSYGMFYSRSEERGSEGIDVPNHRNSLLGLSGWFCP
jgi:hypothetical protein